MRALRWLAVAALSAQASCGAERAADKAVAPVPARTAAPAAASSASTSPAPASPPPVAQTVVTDPAVLGELERRGLSLLELLSAEAYASLASVLEADLEAVRRADPAAGVEVARFSHRLFDARWLGLETSRFELVGVVNRLDRAPFHAGSCGETRLVYRLSYARRVRGEPQSSRLPMTLGLEFRVPKLDSDPSCTEAARRWISSDGSTPTAERLLAPSGPLHRDRLRTGRDDLLVVVNLQQIRWPSTVRPALGGHAEYLLRAFRFDEKGEKLRPAPLENTPDVERLTRDKTLRAELLRWLADPNNLPAIDAGTAVMPDRFAAVRAISVTPRGLSRLANRPFRRLFTSADFATLDFSSARRVRSPEGLLRRLDQLSCPGCHEARSIAGFHLLGEDPPETPVENSIAVALSPHLLDDLPRRRALSARALAGEALDFSAELAERPNERAGGYGAHCALTADPSFTSWTCEPGLECRPYDDPDGLVGHCLPIEAGHAGDPCEVGVVGHDPDFRRDTVRNVSRAECAAGAVCNTNKVGFPGGMCTESCASLGASSTCGAIAVLDPFNACLARKEPFTRCLAENVSPAGLRSCGPDAPCRDDYICAKTKNGAACIPPYFLFQMRVDGH